MTAWLLGLAWGTLAALPAAARARRRRVRDRLVGLAGSRAATRSGLQLPAGLERRLRHFSRGRIGRVVGGVRSRRRARSDAERLTAEMPVTLDLLAVAVGAGCTPYLAVELGARWTPPAMTGYLTSVMEACSLGSSFADALADLGARTPRLRGLADALLSSDRLGAPVGPALARLAGEERAALRRRAEAQARTVPVRLLFPLVFLVLPAFGLLTVVPALLSGFARS